MPTPQDALKALCGAALRGRWRQVEAVLAVEPDLAIQSIHAAAVLLDQDALLAHLADDPRRAQELGPGGLPPLAWVALSEANGGDHGAAARLLVAHGAPPAGGARAALERGRGEVLAALIDGGLTPTTPLDGQGWTLLHVACDVSWRPELVAPLLTEADVDLEARAGAQDETPLHVATRRRRLDAVTLLLDRGAEVDARTRGGDTAYRHAVRRPFPDVADALAARGADSALAPIDEVARALHAGDLEGAAALLDPELVASLAPEEARLLPDLAGQDRTAAVDLLLDHGFDPEARGLDGGTALMNAAWFGAEATARRLVERGAEVNAGGCAHDSTPLGWVTHGSTSADGPAQSQAAYDAILELLLEAGAEVALPGDPPERPGRRALAAASPRLARRLRGWLDD